MRVRINSYNFGNAVRTLKTALSQAVGQEVLRLRPESSFSPNNGDIILNYGDSQCRYHSGNGVTVLNDGAAVGRATNKRDFFRHIGQHNVNHPAGDSQNVPLVEATFDQATAREWVQAGETVFARTRLQGHSGEGIVVCAQNRPNDLGQVQFSETLPQASLYTKAITGARREYRIHVFKGQVILVQKKQRRSGWRQNQAYSDIVRNLDGQWIFGISSANPSDAVRNAAVNAVAALGLDFGAVDVVAKGRQGNEGEAFVLEVNTAPGQGGDTTTDRYVQAIMAVVNDEPAFAPYGRSATAAATTVTGGDAPLTEQLVEARNENRRAQEAEQAPTLNSAAPAPASRPNRNSAHQNSTRNLVNDTVYYGDIVHGERDQLVMFNNGSFYIFGEEVPVEVNNLRTVDVTIGGRING